MFVLSEVQPQRRASGNLLQWYMGTVCDDDWGVDDASVVCRQLGMGSHVIASSCAKFGEGVGTIWMDNVNCSGSEASLAHCTTSGWGVHNCFHDEDAGVVCQGIFNNICLFYSYFDRIKTVSAQLMIS
ncbi:Deleted in malignant brain tumors 1 protein [Apostichopus japonicus]|uniref:Deleted in malignant brain tumors 1 protein n=1 Tax=Stichopus japonicus TaxID=307972 RepID=A0A2G8KDV3_STIJA|nr:Deleted in malignant brain tumors 1 protein [Apostichopus japonicus]